MVTTQGENTKKDGKGSGRNFVSREPNTYMVGGGVAREVEVNWEILVSWRPRRGAFSGEWSAVLNAAVGPTEFKERKASFGSDNWEMLKNGNGE